MSNQPMAPGVANSNEPDSHPLAITRVIISQLKNTAGPLLPILHNIQNAIRYIPDEAIADIAFELSLSQAEVRGVISFYHHFHTSPPGKQTLEICRSESCQAKGGRKLEALARQRLGIGFHETTADNLISLSPVYCLGNCACSPSVRVGNRIYGRVSQERLNDIINDLQTQPIEVR